MRLASRLARVAPSATLAAKVAAEELRARGVRVIDFGPGEPDGATPAAIVAAAHAALERGETHYSDPAGLPALRTALGQRVGSRLGRPVPPSEVIVTCGGKSAILYALLALLDEGDEVLLPSPYWVSFPEQVRLAGGRPVLVPATAAHGFRPRVRDLAAACTPRTRLIVVNSPCNPTGAVLPAEEWRALAALAVERDLMVLSDETYDAFVYGDAPFPSSLDQGAAFGDRLLLANSFSKTWAMTGWRVGWAWGPGPWVRGMVTLQSQDTTHPTTFAQHGALAALASDGREVAAMREEYAARRRLMLEGLAGLPGILTVAPEGAFYVFPEVSEAAAARGCADDTEFALRLLREAHVAVVGGAAFGAPGHVRLSYALGRDAITEGLERLRRWLGSRS